MAVPYTFGAATAAIPLSQLDSNFASTITLGNTAIQLGNTVTILNNMTFANVTISSGSVTITDVTASGNVTISGGTANGVAYLNGSKVLTTGTGLVFDGTNLGLGVNPSAWAFSGNPAIQVKNASFSGYLNRAYVGANTYTNSSGSSIYIASDYATNYIQTSGQHQWYRSTDTTPTAGNAITFTQAMMLDASGNLVVGGTSLSTATGNKTIEVNGTGDSAFNVSVGGTNYGYLYTTTSSTILGTRPSIPLVFNTANTERARIDTSGNFIVGPSGTSAGAIITAKTQTASNSALATLGTSGDTSFQAVLVTKFDNNSTTSQNFIQFQINNGGANCGKITANGANTAAFGSTSDERVKENIADLPSQLANIMALRPVEYDYIESYGGGHQIGFIAQEMQQVYPDVIAEDDSEEKILSITGWSKTEARLVKAIQELKAEIDALKAT